MSIDEKGRINRWDRMSTSSRSTNSVSSGRENILITILLFPSRVVIRIIRGIFLLIFRAGRGIFLIIIAIIKTVIAGPLLFLLLLFSIIVLLPIKIIVFILTFGKINLWEGSIFEKAKNVKDWIGEAWDRSV